MSKEHPVLQRQGSRADHTTFEYAQSEETRFIDNALMLVVEYPNPGVKVLIAHAFLKYGLSFCQPILISYIIEWSSDSGH